MIRSYETTRKHFLKSITDECIITLTPLQKDQVTLITFTTFTAFPHTTRKNGTGKEENPIFKKLEEDMQRLRKINDSLTENKSSE